VGARAFFVGARVRALCGIRGAETVRVVGRVVCEVWGEPRGVSGRLYPAYSTTLRGSVSWVMEMEMGL
jgi:hypothetical protein